MFQHYHQVKSIHSRNYKWVQSHSCRLHDVPVLITNRQCIELKGFHKSFPRLTIIASKNGYFGHFCTKPDRALPDSTGTVTYPEAVWALVCQMCCSKFFRGYFQTINNAGWHILARPSTSRLPGGLHMIYLANFRLNKWHEPQPGIQRALLVTGRARAWSPNDAPIYQPGPAIMVSETGQRPCGPLRGTLRFHFTNF